MQANDRMQMDAISDDHEDGHDMDVPPPGMDWGFDYTPGSQQDFPANAEATASPTERFTVENSTLDLELYSNSYSGLARVMRLLFVAEHSTLQMRVDALRFALQLVHSATFNVALYQDIHRKLVDAIAIVRSSGNQTSASEALKVPLCVIYSNLCTILT